MAKSPSGKFRRILAYLLFDFTSRGLRDAGYFVLYSVLFLYDVLNLRTLYVLHQIAPVNSRRHPPTRLHAQTLRPRPAVPTTLYTPAYFAGTGEDGYMH